MVRFSIWTVSAFFCFLVAGVTLADPLSEDDGAINPIRIEIERILTEMGYTEVTASPDSLSFSRASDNECPTDQSLGYRRVIFSDLLDFSRTFPVYRQQLPLKHFYEFVIPQSLLSQERSIAAARFVLELRRLHSETRWPLRFDRNSQELSNLFQVRFPMDERSNWWTSKTCFGDIARVDVDVRLSFDAYEKLAQLRQLLIAYYQ